MIIHVITSSILVFVRGGVLSCHKSTLLTSNRIQAKAQRNPAIYDIAYQWIAKLRSIISKEIRIGSMFGKGNIASI